MVRQMTPRSRSNYEFSCKCFSKSFQRPTETSPFDHFLDPQSMPRLFLNNKPMVDSNFALIDPVSAVYYGGQAVYVHTRMIA